MFRGEPLSESEIALIRTLIERIGERQAAAKVGLARQTLVRVIAGVRVYPGTASAIRTALSNGQAKAS